jgi:hypothetical protein
MTPTGGEGGRRATAGDACMALNLVYSHNTVNMESAQYNIHCVRGGGGGDKSVTIVCGGGSVKVWTQCAVAAMVRV